MPPGVEDADGLRKIIESDDEEEEEKKEEEEEEEEDQVMSFSIYYYHLHLCKMYRHDQRNGITVIILIKAHALSSHTPRHSLKVKFLSSPVVVLD